MNKNKVQRINPEARYREVFSQAIAYYETGDEYDDCPSVEPHDAAITSDSLSNFIEQWGHPESEVTPVGELYYWLAIQKRKGFRRGDLFVMDFGDLRCAHFDGKV